MGVGFGWREGAEDGAEVALPKSARRRGDALTLSELLIRVHYWQGSRGVPCGPAGTRVPAAHAGNRRRLTKRGVRRLRQQHQRSSGLGEGARSREDRVRGGAHLRSYT